MLHARPISIPVASMFPISTGAGALGVRRASQQLTVASERPQEAERLLNAYETRIFDPAGLPLPDGAEVGHPKVQELRELSLWSEGQVWTPSGTAR